MNSAPAVSFTILILFSLGFLGCSSDSGNSGTAPPVEFSSPIDVLNSHLGRGVNLGNALESPPGESWGVELEESFFDLIQSVGFNSVRIPAKWSGYTEEELPYHIDSSFFYTVDWTIDMIISRGMLAIINIHHFDEIVEDPIGQLPRLLAIWDQIAHHYQDYPEELVFEILNEPHDQLTANLWNDYLAQALAVIRQTNPDRAVMVGTANWGGISALASLQLPEDDALIVTFHYYEPFQFTHQGANWVSGSDAWLGMTWTAGIEQRQAVMADLDLVANWALEHQVPVNMGEFGSFSAADINSRATWTEFVARQAEARGFSWAYWEFCSGFGVYDRDSASWIEPLLDALIPADD